MSAYFVWLNRGKESAALDLKGKEDLALLHRLIAKADIFVQNLAPGAIDRLGLSRVALVEKFPRLIDLIHHPALRRVAVRLPNGAEVRVPRPAGREGLSREMPIGPEMGADTGRIRREFGI